MKWATLQHRFLRLVMAIAGSAALVFAALPFANYRKSSSLPLPQAGEINLDLMEGLRDTPVSFSSEARAVLDIAPSDMQKILGQVEPPDHDVLSASLCLHVLATHGLEARFRHSRFKSAHDVLRLLTDEEFGKQYFGGPVMLPSRFGIRQTTGWNNHASESHYDQMLGCMGQLGLPLWLEFIVGDHQSYTLYDVLRDSIACFDLRQNEIEWTAIAYAHYLPPHREWINKFGQRCSFDQVSDELLKRDLGSTSCCGCHVVEAIITLLRIDASEKCLLTVDSRAALTNYLRSLVGLALASQDADGAWGPAWYLPVPPANNLQGATVRNASDASRLLATSHITHWMLDLPEDLRVPTSALIRAGNWLHLRLKDARPGFVKENFCPCCHGAYVLRLLSGAEWSEKPESTFCAPVTYGDKPRQVR